MSSPPPSTRLVPGSDHPASRVGRAEAERACSPPLDTRSQTLPPRWAFRLCGLPFVPGGKSPRMAGLGDALGVGVTTSPAIAFGGQEHVLGQRRDGVVADRAAIHRSRQVLRPAKCPPADTFGHHCGGAGSRADSRNQVSSFPFPFASIDPRGVHSKASPMRR